MSELVFDTSCMAEVLDLAFSLSFLPGQKEIRRVDFLKDCMTFTQSICC